MNSVYKFKHNRTKIYIWVISILAGGVIGIFYSLSVGGNPIIAFPTGCAITGGVIGFELLYVQQHSGTWLRKLPLPIFITISSLVWTLIISSCLLIIPQFFGHENAYGQDYTATTLRQDVAFSLLIAFLMNTVLRIRSLVGGRVLMNFLLGRYHRPLREERVFLFLDLADSTQLAEQLGDIQVQSLIGQFFFDIARPIAQHGGETHRYIGDEIVVTWPLSEAIKDVRCVHCMFAIQELINDRSLHYQAQFGVIPKFRAGMHAGPVVASEVGDDKREIVYFGDTVNTAARLQSLCKEKKSDFLASGELIEALQLPAETKAQQMGQINLRGKSMPLEVFALSR